jgi:hypothetical protein
MRAANSQVEVQIRTQHSANGPTLVHIVLYFASETKGVLMASKNIAVFGIFRSREAIEEAIAALEKAGFRSTDISALLPENEGTKDLAHEKHTKAPEGAAAGTVTGGAIGGILGGLVGVGLIAIPGLGPLIAAGPIIAALTGVGSGGVVGGVIGALAGLGIPEYEAKRYEGRIKLGGLLLSVHCDDDHWVKRAKEILQQTGGEEIASTTESSADYAVSDRPMPRVRRAGSPDPAPTSLNDTEELTYDELGKPLPRPR